MLTFENIFASMTRLRGYINRLPVPSTAMSEAFGRGMMAQGTVDAPEPNSPGALITYYDGTRRMAKGRAIDVRPNTVSPRGGKTKWVKPMHFAESMPFHHNRMGGAQALGLSIDDPKAEHIRLNLQMMKESLAMAHEFMWVRTLLDGFKYSTTVNNDYILQESTYAGGDAVTVVTNEVPASHKSQIALGVANADIIDEPWDDPTANLFGQFMRLNVAVARETGMPVAECWMNGNTAYHLMQNTAIRTILGQNANLLRSFEERKPSLQRALQPQTFYINGLDIRFVVYDGVVTIGDEENLSYDQLITSTYATLLIPNDRVIMTPPRETANQWSGFVPIKRDITETSNLTYRPGVVGYDTYRYNTSFPSGFMVEQSGGGLPFLTIPRAVFSPTVIFE